MSLTLTSSPCRDVGSSGTLDRRRSSFFANTRHLHPIPVGVSVYLGKYKIIVCPSGCCNICPWSTIAFLGVLEQYRVDRFWHLCSFWWQSLAQFFLRSSRNILLLISPAFALKSRFLPFYAFLSNCDAAIRQSYEVLLDCFKACCYHYIAVWQ